MVIKDIAKLEQNIESLWQDFVRSTVRMLVRRKEDNNNNNNIFDTAFIITVEERDMSATDFVEITKTGCREKILKYLPTMLVEKSEDVESVIYWLNQRTE